MLGAAYYNGFLALTQVPQEAAAWVGDSDFSPWLILILILVFYLMLGCFLDSLSMILLVVPIFYPIVQELDFGLVSMIELQTSRLDALVASGKEISAALLREAQGLLVAS